MVGFGGQASFGSRKFKLLKFQGMGRVVFVVVYAIMTGPAFLIVTISLFSIFLHDCLFIQLLKIAHVQVTFPKLDTLSSECTIQEILKL